jgi:hypothetical protein
MAILRVWGFFRHTMQCRRLDGFRSFKDTTFPLNSCSSWPQKMTAKRSTETSGSTQPTARHHNPDALNNSGIPLWEPQNSRAGKGENWISATYWTILQCTRVTKPSRVWSAVRYAKQDSRMRLQSWRKANTLHGPPCGSGSKRIPCRNTTDYTEAGGGGGVYTI